MFRSRPALSALLLASLGLCASWGPLAFGEDPDPASAQVLKALQAHYPKTHFDSVQPSQTLPGWYEVQAGKQLVYSSPKADRLIVGYIVDTETKQDLTAKRWDELNLIDFDKLPFDHAIKIVKGSGSRRFAAFEDPLCPFCQKLERDSLSQMTNYTLYVFLMPLEEVHPGATEKAKQIWCTADRAQAWSLWMAQQTAPVSVPGKTCDDDPIAANAALAERLHVVATPTLVFGDGTRLDHAVPPKDLEVRLERGPLVQSAAR